mmetsp:Transcript_15700/g.54521  ORF Transcript_15700/g.54521 Transcript_15700/m.54521 type:complete len:294 (-) Transcript_15700:197-1078(-)
MLQVPQVEHAHRAVRAHRRELVLVPPERDVVHGLVVRDELRLGLLRVDVPNGARGVDRGRADDVEVLLVPVERRQRRAVLALLVVVQQAHLVDLAAVHHLPQPQVVARRCQQILPARIRVWTPHDLRRRVRVVEQPAREELARLVVELHHLHLVAVLLDEGAHGIAEGILGAFPHAHAQAIHGPRRHVGVDLLLLRLRHRAAARDRPHQRSTAPAHPLRPAGRDAAAAGPDPTAPPWRRRATIDDPPPPTRALLCAPPAPAPDYPPYTHAPTATALRDGQGGHGGRAPAQLSS